MRGNYKRAKVRKGPYNASMGNYKRGTQLNKFNGSNGVVPQAQYWSFKFNQVITLTNEADQDGGSFINTYSFPYQQTKETGVAKQQAFD